jgi:hypothetical protein
MCWVPNDSEIEFYWRNPYLHERREMDDLLKQKVDKALVVIKEAIKFTLPGMDFWLVKIV